MVKRYGKEIRTVDIYQENLELIKAEGKEPKTELNALAAANYAVRSLSFPTMLVTQQIVTVNKVPSILVTDVNKNTSATLTATKNRRLYCNAHKSENCEHTAAVWAGYITLVEQLFSQS